MHHNFQTISKKNIVRIWCKHQASYYLFYVLKPRFHLWLLNLHGVTSFFRRHGVTSCFILFIHFSLFSLDFSILVLLIYIHTKSGARDLWEDGWSSPFFLPLLFLFLFLLPPLHPWLKNLEAGGSEPRKPPCWIRSQSIYNLFAGWFMAWWVRLVLVYCERKTLYHGW